MANLNRSESCDISRLYYRCMHHQSQGCTATKQMQPSDGDLTLFDVIYHNTHTCVQRTATATMVGQVYEATHLTSTSSELSDYANQPIRQTKKRCVPLMCEFGPSLSIRCAKPSWNRVNGHKSFLLQCG